MWSYFQCSAIVFQKNHTRGFCRRSTIVLFYAGTCIIIVVCCLSNSMALSLYIYINTLCTCKYPVYILFVIFIKTLNVHVCSIDENKVRGTSIMFFPYALYSWWGSVNHNIKYAKIGKCRLLSKNIAAYRKTSVIFRENWMHSVSRNPMLFRRHPLLLFL